METKYIIMRLDDAQALVNPSTPRAQVAPIAERIRAETGADIEDIVAQLKALEICAACDIEGQASHCQSIKANKLGRRLRRLVDRANAGRK